MCLHDFCGNVETAQCVLCLSAPARIYGGHVTNGPYRIIAGWCEPCSKRLHAACCARLRDVVRQWTIKELLACDLVGWHGHWLSAMGMRLRCSPCSAAIEAADWHVWRNPTEATA